MFIIYVIGVLLVSSYLAARTDRRLLSFVLVFWILAQPIFASKFIIALPGLPDLHPNRLLFVVLLAYLFLAPRVSRQASAGQDMVTVRVPFEKYLYIFPVITFLSLAVNYGKIKPQDIASIPLEIIAFIVVYLVTKRFVTQKVLESILKAIIVMAAVGALIAFIQFAGDGGFMRTGEIRGAFGNVARASGIFLQEYDFGAFQAFGLMTTFIFYRNSFLRYLLMPLIGMSVLLTFHRLDIIILAVCLIAYFWFFVESAQKVMVTFLLLFAMGGAVALYPIIGDMIGQSAVVTTLEGRIGQDTVTGRIEQYKVAAEYIFTDYTLLGMGNYENPAYDDLMHEHGMMNFAPDGKLIGFRLHNGYLEVGILRGVVAMFVFTAMLVSMLVFFKRRASQKVLYSAVPFFAVFVWMLANISNGVSSFNFYYSLLCAILAGAFVQVHGVWRAEVPGQDEVVEKSRLLQVRKVLGS